MREHVLSSIRPSFPGLSQSQGQVTHVLLTRSPLEHPQRGLSARLACVKHAASVRPEPGSNSPSRPNQTNHPPPPPHQKARQQDSRQPAKTQTENKTPAKTQPPTTNTGRPCTCLKETQTPEQPHPQPQKAKNRTTPEHRNHKKALATKKHAVEFSKNGHPPPEPPTTQAEDPNEATPQTYQNPNPSQANRRTETLLRFAPATLAVAKGDPTREVPRAGRRIGVLHPGW